MKLSEISKQLNSALDARILVKRVTGLNDADLIGLSDIPLTDNEKAILDDYVLQRLGGRPVAKIIGYKEFYGLNFIVTDDVLDPRPDSEILIDIVLKYANGKNNLRILDLGTGSGCLILTLLSEIPNAAGVAVDISSKALLVAAKNADKLGVANRVKFIESSWLENVDGEFDIIVSNPPYIESGIISTLDIDVREYDPILALDGGEDGLNPYKVILPQIRHNLKIGGIVALEHGSGQSERIKRLVENSGLSDIISYNDFGGHDRVITAIHK